MGAYDQARCLAAEVLGKEALVCIDKVAVWLFWTRENSLVPAGNHT
jgi:hypothetical protein